MAISPLSSNIVNLLSPEPVASKDQSGAGSFADVFSEAIGNVSATDQKDKLSALELLSGQSDDMSGLLLDAQKAEIALNLALTMRSKVLEAYNDIMRMQI